MAKKLFPYQIIEENIQNHFWQHSIRSQVLYSSILLSLILVFTALPYLYVDISVTSQGIIRPESERKKLFSPVSGRVAQWEIRENDTISKGTLVAEIESPLLQDRLNYNRDRQKEMAQYLQDLVYLTALDSTAVLSLQPRLKAAVFNRSLMAFQQELRSHEIDLQNARRIYRRQQYLYEKEAVSLSQLKETEFAFHSIKSRYRLLFDQRMSEWEAELVRYQQELDQLKAEELQLIEEQRLYKIYMPVNGTVQNLAGITEGSYIQTNQQLADISPDTGLVAECYVSPRDVGMLREGMEVRFQVDAFNYNQWGTLTGKVTDISNDAVMRGNQPFFRVQSVLDQSWLQLPNGYKGFMKKGMTLQARFKVTERSLFQLMFDNADDWLNPAWNDSGEMVQAG